MNIDRLIKDVAMRFFVTTNDIYSDKRNKDVVDARKVLYKTLYMLGYTTTQIGEILGKDHTTIVAGKRKIVEDSKLFDIAMEMFEKYTTPSDSIDLELDVARKILLYAVKQGINTGKTVKDISKEIGLNESIILRYVENIVKEKTKKVPDYKNGGYKIIY